MKNADMPSAPQLDWEYVGSDLVSTTSGGLTKREHFAAMAMQGLLANSSTGDSTLWETPEEWTKQMAECSVEFADATLAELEK